MVEVAVLLPVYVLILIGLIYFGNEGLFWQEVSQSARFIATNTQSGGGGSGTPGIANTNGPNVGQDFFLYFQGTKTPTTASSRASFTQQQIRDELIKASWNISQTFDLVNGSSTTSQSLTREGSAVYPDGTTYAFDGDDALIAQELSDWFTRSSSTLTLTYDSTAIRVMGLPAATTATSAEAVHRIGTETSRNAGTDPGGSGVLDHFYSTPFPHYPDFMSTQPFWTPN